LYTPGLLIAIISDRLARSGGIISAAAKENGLKMKLKIKIGAKIKMKIVS
jgi:hypothetical protein